MLAALLVLGALPAVSLAEEAPPTTTIDGAVFYQLDSAADLTWFAQQVNGGSCAINAIMTADIVLNTGDLSGYDGSSSNSWTQWTPIGDSSNNGFVGTFDGNGHTISGVYININNQTKGLFAHISTGGVVKNLGIVNSYLRYSGTSETSVVGAICGNAYKCTITNCYNTGTVSGVGRVGGLCAESYRLTMTNCYNAGKVIATGNLAAGIVASPSTFCTFTNCFNVGSITAPSDTGGIVSSNYGIVVNSYYSSDCGGVGSGTAMPTSKFQSGEVAYRLNGSVSGGSPWRQTLSVDEYPVLDSTHGMIYYAYADCDAQTLSYCNVRHDTAGHSYDNGVCIYCGAYQAADSNASGIYEIANAGQLHWFAALVNGTLTDGTAQNRAAGGILTADITLNDETFEYMAATGLVKVTDGTNVGYVDTREGKQGDWYVDANGTTAGAYSGTLDVWTPIGDFNTSNQNIYLGAFDGAGHSISGLYTGDSAKSYQGLFGYAAYGLIERVCVSNSFRCGSQSVGGICGRSDTNIQKCCNAATVTATNDVGGVCGGLDSQTIQDCCNLGAFFGAYNYGGVCGQNKGTIQNSYHAGVIINTSAYAIKGSICSANANGTIQNCYYLGAADDSTSGTTAKSAAQFASGEVCYLLNNGVTDNTQAWYQTIGTHAVPQFEGASVYYAEHGNPQYSNNAPVYWTVQYVADGAVVATLQVLDGQSLSEIPTVPQKTGYDQTAPVWETDLFGVAITQNYTVNVKYTINTYTVTFVADGAMVAEYTVDWNATLT